MGMAAMMTKSPDGLCRMRRKRHHGFSATARRRTDLRALLTTRNAVMAVLAFGLAFLAFSHSLAQIAKRPVLALGAIGQHNSGLLKVRAGDVQLGQPVRDPLRVERAARDTIAFAPLNSSAVSLIGLVRDQQGDANGALRAMEAATRLSRREPAAQLWLGQKAVRSGDLRQVLNRYDIIMRTQPVTRPIVFNVLTQTLTDPQMRREMQRFVGLQNDWFEGFAIAAAEKPQTSALLAQLLMDSRAIPDTRPLRSAYATVVRDLVGLRKFDLAIALFERLPGATPAILRSVALPANNSAQYPPANWYLATDASAGASLLTAGGKQLLDLYVAFGTGGLGARKMLALQPGSYSFGWRLLDMSVNPGSSARIVVLCSDDTADRVIAERMIPNRDGDPGEEFGPVSGQLNFSVPASDCGVQMLDFRLSGGRSRDEARWLFGDFGLKRVGKAAVTPAIGSTAS